MTELKRLQAKKKAYQTQIGKLQDKSTAAMSDGAEDMDLVTSTTENLKTKITLLQDLDEKILELSPLAEMEQYIETADDYLTGVKEHVTKCEQFLIRKKNTENQNTSFSAASVTSGHSTQSQTPKKRLNLPKLTIPTFDGTITNWQMFFDAFTSAIGNDDQMDDVQKFQYLQAQLTDEAKKTIEGLTLTSANYANALELLKKRYGQTHKQVSAYMRALWDLPQPDNDVVSMRSFHDTIESYIRGLQTLGKSEDTYGDLLIPVLLDKLPSNIRVQISREHGNKEWNLSELRKAILAEIEALEAGNPTQEPKLQATAAFLTNSHTKREERKPFKPIPCAFCKSTTHKATECQIVPDYEKRLEVVKRNKLCFNCLRNHRVSACKSKGRCRHCSKKHHTSLCNSAHNNETPADGITKHNEKTEPKKFEGNEPTQVVYANTLNDRRRVILKTAKAQVMSDTSRITANILLDEGAQRSFITTNAAEKLNLKCTETEDISLATFGSKTTGVQSLKVGNIKIQAANGPAIDIQALIIPRITTSMKNHVDLKTLNLPYLRDLQIAEQPDTEAFTIDILIGADFYWDIVQDRIIRGAGPTAVSSKLGYLLSGPVAHTSVNSCGPIDSSILHVMADTQQEQYSLHKFWDLETIGIKEDPQATTKSDFITYKDTHLKTDPEDGKYIARLPWKPEHPPLPTNRDVAEIRTRHMVRKLEPNLREVYNDIIQEQLQRGFIEEVQNDDKSGHYIPHHSVVKDSHTTPLRVVYDCSCKTSNNPSINDCLEKGQPLLNGMVAILLRFRTRKIGLTSDIEKAFLNIKLDTSDKKFTKFFWLSDFADPESNFKVYQFSSVLFGAACSPFILNAVVKTELEKQGDTISCDLKDNIYVDNVVTGAETSEEAMNYYKTANTTMQSRGFKLRSWATNDETVAEIATQDNVLEQNTQVKVLGLTWDTKTDKLSYAKINKKNNVIITKREIVRQTSSLFDPLGYLSPVHVKAKILIQQLWESGVGWDEPLQEAVTKQWNAISSELKESTDITVNRRYFDTVNSSKDYVLHTFADASTKAYSAAVYICHDKQSSLVMAKTRVKPLKEITLPRLELMAVLIATRLTHFVHDALKPKLNITKCAIWTDSQIVIHWIRSGKTLPTFIHNRVKEINASQFEIKWCPTHQNPADLLTRGITATELKESTLWWKGPHWLKDGDWPICELFDSDPTCALLQGEKSTETKKNTETENTNKCTDVGIHRILDVRKYSSLGKLLRVSAYVLRFVSKLRKATKQESSKSLTASEITTAEIYWIKACQMLAFNQEIQSIQHQNKTVPNLQKQLKLFTDDQGILRCGSRLHNAPINYDTKFPILLPPQHQLTELIILDCHQKVLHSGLQATVAQIRQRYWITKIRQRVKTLLRKCVVCKKINGKPYSAPINPPLPQCRLQESSPFTITGLDFTGELYVKCDNNKETKAYVCLFTCAVTRAVHLELVKDLTTRSFLLALRRFAARRSLPSTIISDNASTYISAAKELNELFSSPTVKGYLAANRVEWKFITKRAPWFGGFYERLIGLTKTCLKKTLGRAFVTFRELETILCEIEAILNDRPLTYVSGDFNEPTPLTPSTLLHGRRITTLPHQQFDSDEPEDPTYLCKPSLERRAIQLAELQHRFWRRWAQEYLPALQEHNKTSGKMDNVIKVGDIVLVHAETNRLKWNIAMVQRLNYGKDGLVRSAEIKTKHGYTNRPITKLYPLEVCANDVSVPQDNEHSDLDIPTPRENGRTPRKAAVTARDGIKGCYM